MTAPTPTRLDLRKTEGLHLAFSDGAAGFIAIGKLRRLCPCAGCREHREQLASRPRSLTVLGDATDTPLAVESAQLVGNYALQIKWTDGHSAGIYSFVYLRSLLESSAAPAP